jgi:hypothetical protein
MDVNTIKKRTGDALLIFGHDRMGAGAGLLCIPIKSTWTGMYTIELFLLFNNE